MKIQKIIDPEVLNDAYNTLCCLEKYYPNFSYWYYKKVANVMAHKSHCLIEAIENDKVVGYMVLKDNLKERKICTLYIPYEERGKGIGEQLMQYAINKLNTKQPKFTVNQELLSEYEPLLKKFNFQLKCIFYDFYIKGQCEYVYNSYTL